MLEQYWLKAKELFLKWMCCGDLLWIKMDIEKVKVLDWEIEFYDILSNVIQIHIRKGLTEKKRCGLKPKVQK